MDEEEAVGNWLIDFEHKMRVKHRIACPEVGYPASEAHYMDEKEWSKDNDGQDWDTYIAEIA